MKGYGSSVGPIVWWVAVGMLLGCSVAEAPTPNAKAGAERAAETSAVGSGASRVMIETASGDVVIKGSTIKQN